MRRRSQRRRFISALGSRGVIHATGRRVSDLPEVLCFDESPTKTLQALLTIRRSLNIGRPNSGRRFRPMSKHAGAKPRRTGTYWSFETVRSITPAAALVLAAEYERHRVLTNYVPFVVNVDRWSGPVYRALQQVGFFNIVGIPNLDQELPQQTSVTLLPMRSGATTDSEEISKLLMGLSELYPEPAPQREEAMLHLYGALVEAVGNVKLHAYPDNAQYPYPPVRRWWMTGAVDKAAGWTTAVVYDQGITIPVSLPNWNRYSGVVRRMLAAAGQALGAFPAPSDPRNDGRAIAAAVEEAVSSTGLEQHGKGLAQMRDFVNGCQEGYLRILSRCGEVVFRPGSRREIRTHDVPLDGTLIEWSVQL